MTRGITQMGVPKVEAKLRTPKSLQQLEIVRGEPEEQGGRGCSDALGDRISQLVCVHMGYLFDHFCLRFVL